VVRLDERGSAAGVVVIDAKIAAFAVALLLVSGLFVTHHLRRTRRLRQTLAGREPVPAVDFGSRYYTDATAAEAGRFVVATLQELTGYELTGVLPSDRIVADLDLDELDSLAAVEVITAVEARFAIDISDEEAIRTKTIHDFVELVVAKIKERTPPS
jgi:acyl carrier protein